MIEVGHRCRARDNCVASTAEGSAITSASDTICDGCVLRLQEQLQQLPHFAEALESFKRRSLVGAAGARVGGTREPPVPINLGVVDLISEIAHAVLRAGGVGAQIGSLITEPAIDYPLWRGGRLRNLPLDGVDRALAIGDAWRKADRMVGISRRWERRAAPCLRCGLRTLGMFSGENTVHCTNSACAKTYPLDEYDRLCIARAEVEKIEKKKEKKQ